MNRIAFISVLLLISGYVFAQGNGSLKVSPEMWTNPSNDQSWATEGKDIIRTRNGRISVLKYKDQIDGPLRIEYTLKATDYRRGDGRGADLRWTKEDGTKGGCFFTYGDDYSFGMVGPKRNGQGGWEYYAGSNDIKVEVGKQHHVIIEVLSDGMTMQVDGKRIETDHTPKPPYELGIQVQRGGTEFKNFMIKKLPGNAKRDPKDGGKDEKKLPKDRIIFGRRIPERNLVVNHVVYVDKGQVTGGYAEGLKQWKILGGTYHGRILSFVQHCSWQTRLMTVDVGPETVELISIINTETGQEIENTQKVWPRLAEPLK